MILEIEYFKGETQLVGKTRDYTVIKEQLDKAEELYDRHKDDFVALLCRMFDWAEAEKFKLPDYVYDRDVKELFRQRMR